tara:strand:+ start:14863 stop:15075 length:213 start_codon:yes stop_codon:yes gene_type:complete
VIAPDAGTACIRQLDLAGDLEASAIHRYRKADGLLKPVKELARSRAHGVVVTAMAGQILAGNVFQSALRA